MNLKKVKLENENVYFEVITEDTIANAIKNLPTGKASVSNDIPFSIMKESIDGYCPKPTQITNDYLENNIFAVLKKEIRVKKKIIYQLASC